MFVSREIIEQVTGKKYARAQGRALNAMGIHFKWRPDGKILLRQDELDLHTLSKPPKRRRDPSDDDGFRWSSRGRSDSPGS